MFAVLADTNREQDAELIKPWLDQIQFLAPRLENHLVHLPIWALTATRVD
jgi:hypothetical protein